MAGTGLALLLTHCAALSKPLLPQTSVSLSQDGEQPSLPSSGSMRTRGHRQIPLGAGKMLSK